MLDTTQCLKGQVQSKIFLHPVKKSQGLDVLHYSYLSFNFFQFCFGHKGKFEGKFSVVASGFKDGNLVDNKAFSVSSFQIPQAKLSER